VGRAPPLDTRLAEPLLNTTTRTQYALLWLPRPEERVPIAVYGVADETGAFKPSDTVQTLSRAVTQGATSILIKSLQDAGNRGWFTVVERENLDNLLRERQIILEMRQRYLGESPMESNALPSLFFAGIIIEGAITGYDTNLRTGGAGAAYLGIGASTQYRQDAVSVYLRAISVKTGEVLVSVTTEQRIASVAVQGSAFRFVAFQELLEAEAGVTFNDPRHLAVRQAFEKGVYGLIIEGARAGIWSFEDSELGKAAIDHYEQTYSTALSPDLVNSIPEIFYTAGKRARERENQAGATSSRSSVANLASPQTMFAPSTVEETLAN
jgi:curli production assembly/transport component CsgG